MCGADSLERSFILKDAEGLSEKKLSGFLVISQAKRTERLVMLMSKVLFGKSRLLGFFKFFAFYARNHFITDKLFTNQF